MRCTHEQVRIVGTLTAHEIPMPQVLTRGETLVTRGAPPSPVENLVTVRMKPQWCPWCHGEGDVQ